MVLGGVAAVSLLATGATYEAAARHYPYRDFPLPGRLIDIGGRRIQLNCLGSGSPTVVFEAGLDTYGSLSWSAVQSKVSKVTRACSYSRAGIMWSDPHKGLFSAKGVADGLHAALSNAGEQGPFVMVGHSLGGPYVMTFTKYYGSDVAGIVFVDASHPDQVQILKPVAPDMADPMPLTYKLGASLAWSGALRVGAALSMQAQP
jgi:pimeloyl-ACP methyl ester carboxylesterase